MAHYQVPAVVRGIIGSRTWVRGMFSRPGHKRIEDDKLLDHHLSRIEQEERLQNLQKRLHVPFDETRLDHQTSLLALWRAAFPDVTLKGLVSEQWKDMGWQGTNPSTDFRHCGFFAVENLLFLARTYPASFLKLLFKTAGKRATWEYPFAVAGINITFMLIQMLDLYSEDEDAFDDLYCIAFALMDVHWLAMEASYMEFNEVLRRTRMQLEKELSIEDIRVIQDLPAYNILFI
ncbi:uncharacterized protein LOC141696686 isoform X3 [Apium graveolens]|uniref:uncharacterized protein LOC141696686 isoform X3 n=1 Tax=Apium graveolens TaxID=4045 RepID=UPI003D7B1D38